jgi:hypothetical protein
MRAGWESSSPLGESGFLAGTDHDGDGQERYRQSRRLGIARTHLQQLLTATAMNMVRVIAWLRGEPLGERRRKLGHFVRLAPHPLPRQTVLW